MENATIFLKILLDLFSEQLEIYFKEKIIS